MTENVDRFIAETRRLGDLPRYTREQELYYQEASRDLSNRHIFSLMADESAAKSRKQARERIIREGAWAYADWCKSPEGKRASQEALDRKVEEERRKIGDNFPKLPSTLLVSFEPLPAPTWGETSKRPAFSLKRCLQKLWEELRS